MPRRRNNSMPPTPLHSPRRKRSTPSSRRASLHPRKQIRPECNRRGFRHLTQPRSNWLALVQTRKDGCYTVPVSAISTVEGKPQSRKLAVGNRPVIRHVQRVAQAGDSRQLCRRDPQPGARSQLTESSRRRKSCRCSCIARAITTIGAVGPRRWRKGSATSAIFTEPSPPLVAKSGSLQPDCIIQTRVMAAALSNHATEVKQMQAYRRP